MQQFQLTETFNIVQPLCECVYGCRKDNGISQTVASFNKNKKLKLSSVSCRREDARCH